MRGTASRKICVDTCWKRAQPTVAQRDAERPDGVLETPPPDLTLNVEHHAMAQTTVPLNTPTEQPTRRALLGTMAAAGIVGAAPAVMAAGDVDPHLPGSGRRVPCRLGSAPNR